MQFRFLFLFGFILSLLQAQNPWGIQTSNYGGLYSVDLQPANLADNRISTDVNLAGFNFDLWNNYARIASPLLRSGNAWEDRLDTTSNARIFFPDRLNNREKDLYINGTGYSFGFMQTLPNGLGIALTSRFRNVSSLNNVSEVLAKQAYEGQEFTPFYNRPVNNDGLSFNLASYLELGAGLGVVIFDKGDRFLKAGARLKYLTGIGGISFHAWTGRYTFLDDSLVTISDADVSYAHSSIFETQNGSSLDPFDFLFGGNNGFAADIGLVYEFRPDADRYKYGVGKYRQHRPDKDAYKARIGLSLLDIGGINFTRSTLSQNFSGAKDSINIDRINIEDVVDISQYFQDNFTVQPGSEAFRMQLPSRLSIQADYRFSDKFATQAVLVQKLGSPSFRRIQAQNSLAVIPRFETKQFSFSLPVVWQSYRSLNAGAFVRLGPFFAGSNNLINLFVTDFNSTASYYGGIRIAIPYGKPRDRDQDGILNKDDDCPTEPGLETLAGCPEPESQPMYDLIEVTVSAKPLWPLDWQIPFMGNLTVFESRIIPVPDTVPAIAREDSLPPKPEPEETSEQPAPESVTTIPERSPAPANVRPPLTVKPETLDPVKAYLPYTDRDGDGVPNVEDACPDIPGTVNNEGCPEIGPGKRSYRKNIYTSLYFDTDQYQIRPRGKEILERLVDYLEENPSASLLIEGHTDNSGKEIYNTDLSLNRTMAAVRYLALRGVSLDRLEIAHYGERYPAAPNTTPVGMQLNRRVDITIRE